MMSAKTERTNRTRLPERTKQSVVVAVVVVVVDVDYYDDIDVDYAVHKKVQI